MENEDYQKWLSNLNQIQKQMEPLQSVIQKQILPMQSVLQQISIISESMQSPVKQYSEMASAISYAIKQAMPTKVFLESISAASIAATENLSLLRNFSIPHMPLYQEIIGSIDEDSFEQIQEAMEEQPFEEYDEGVTIARPHFYNAAVTINLYTNMTNEHIENNEAVSEEEKKTWKSVILPILLFIQQVFMTWAFGDTPIKEMQIVQQFDKVIEVIEDYQYPIETTEPNLKKESEEG